MERTGAVMTESILNPQFNTLMRDIVAVSGKFKFATVERPSRAAPSEVLVRIERIFRSIAVN